MKATEVGGEGRTAKIDGQLRLDGWLTANIDGAGVNCKSVVIPLLRASSAAARIRVVSVSYTRIYNVVALVICGRDASRERG